MAYDYLLYDVKDGIGVVTLNRPERRNALSMALLEELLDIFKIIGKGSV